MCAFAGAAALAATGFFSLTKMVAGTTARSASASTATSTFSPMSTPPVSSAWFQARPKSFRLSATLPH
jgi:hypothetical protein